MLDLEKVSVDDIMVPRNEIIGIDIIRRLEIDRSPADPLSSRTHRAVSRLAGRRHQHAARTVKPIAWMTEKKEFTKEVMLRAADEIYFVPEGTPLSTQLVKFQRNKKKVGCLVVDEYG
ncbi:hypothetical protein [Raoultella planticola]|uniref:hypothetical protein n=1 Tax=Raoultella planticola TaxID=575 RepID=UPI001C9E1C80|nr:hypothetical protein [Raoultella planticola]QZS65445.1 hypothetical protein K6028_06260 [Raoultella planticola]